MAGIRSIFLNIGLVTLLFSYVLALDYNEKQAIVTKALPFIAECSKDHPITDGSIQTVVESGKFTALNDCFIACVFKRFGIITGDGMFDAQNSLEIAKEHLSSEDMKSAPDAINTCKSVNDKQVSDGDKGCERAHHLIDCASTFIASMFSSN